MAVSDVPATIAEALAQSQAYAEDLRLAAEQAAEDLRAFVTDQDTWIDFEGRRIYDPRAASRVVPDEIPDLVRASMPLDLALFDPDRYKSHTYVSDFFDFLEPKLTEFIETGGTGIDDAVQTALFDNHRERKQKTRDDEILAATANVAKRGFPLPTDMVQAAIAVVIARYADQEYNTSREITTIIADLAQKNVQHAIDAGIRMESIQSEFTRFFHQAYTEYARQILEKFKVEQETNLQQFRGDIDLVNTNLRADEINASLSQKFTDQNIAAWKVEVDHSIEKTKANIAQADENARNQLQAAQGLVDYYRTAVAGIAGQLNTITMASEATSS